MREEDNGKYKVKKQKLYILLYYNVLINFINVRCAWVHHHCFASRERRGERERERRGT